MSKPENVPQVVEQILDAARSGGASDVHLVPRENRLEMSWRVDGVLTHVAEFPAHLKGNIVSRLKVLAGLLTYRTEVPQEGRISVETDSIEMRVSTFPTLFGEKAVVRLFVGSGDLQQLDSLTLPDEVSTRLREALHETGGVILVTGPAGSGKTTTSYACLREIAATATTMRSIATLEDPIEAVIAPATQSHVNAANGFDYETALKSLLRQDPEVIMVGEIRDPATAALVFQAALTGHLVLTTFHAGSAAEAVARLLDMGIEPYQLRSGVLCVLNQRLVRRLCSCSITANDVEGRLGLPVTEYHVPQGCEACSGTGFLGRLPLVELMTVDNHQTGSAILSRQDSAEIERCAVEAGMQTRWQRAIALPANKLNSPEKVDADEFAAMLVDDDDPVIADDVVDDYEDYDAPPRRRPPRRSRRDDYDDDEEDDYEVDRLRSRPRGGSGGMSKTKRWKLTSVGMLIVSISMCVFAAAVAFTLIAELMVQLAGVGRGSISGLQGGARVYKIAVVIALLAEIGLIVGYAFTVFVPSKYGSMGLAIAALVLSVVNFVLQLVFVKIPVLSDKGIHVYSRWIHAGFAGGVLDAGDEVLSLFLELAIAAEFLVFCLFLAAVARTMADRRHKADCMRLVWGFAGYAGLMLFMYIFVFISPISDGKWLFYLIRVLNWLVNGGLAAILVFYIMNLRLFFGSSPTASAKRSPHKPPVRKPRAKLDRTRYRSRFGDTAADPMCVVDELPYRFARYSPDTTGEGEGRRQYFDMTADRSRLPAERGLPLFHTPDELADWLRMPVGRLAWLIHRGAHLDRPETERDAHYYFRWMKKRTTGWRLIEAPKAALKSAQTKILDEILSRVPVHETAHGFTRGRSVLTNAAPHVGRHVVVKFDLENFYAAVGFARVVAIFRRIGYCREAANWLARLTTSALPPGIAFPQGDPNALQPYLRRHLPQGAPTSPALANLSAIGLDVRLSGLAKSYRLSYTRYADDLTFSGGPSLIASLRTFLPLATQIVREERFALQMKKRKVIRRHQRQTVTGVVVNQKTNVSRRDYDRLKAILTNCLRHGPQSQNRDAHDDFAAHLRGRVAHVAQLNPARGAKLLAIFERIRW
eukprot:g12580.t1